MRKEATRAAFLTPLGVLMALLAVVVLSHRGLQAEARPARLAQLAAETSVQSEQGTADILLLTGGMSDICDTVEQALQQMKLDYDLLPAETLTPGALEAYRTVLYTRPDLAAIAEETLVRLIGWVEAGGRFALMCTPDPDSGFAIIYRKLGVMDRGDTSQIYTSLRYAAGVLPVQGDALFAQELSDYMLPVRLEEDCRVHMRTGGTEAMPLLWTRELGKGRVCVFNTNLTMGRDARGYVTTVLSLLEDALVYPIVNAGMVFIDDFPAPQPEGFDDRLKEQYGFDIQGFFRNHWWPDMKRLTWTKGLRYTGVLVETYNDNVDPPFAPDSEEHALIRYYASEILQSGGEIGLHGYNHQPLCPDGFDYNGKAPYKTWHSREDMAQAITELMRYGNAFLPNAQFSCYVPPSNYLSPEGQDMLMDTVDGLSTISGLYLNEEGVNALVQEFREEADGSISVPRITSGFSPDAYNTLILSQELALHGVLSHFIHPDDVLDDDRGAALGWEQLFADFENMLNNVISAYPQLRFSTASEGAAAVQRYDRVQIGRAWQADGSLCLTLSPFYDEVWLALWCDATPAVVEGAECYRQSDRLCWLRATEENVRIVWEAAP